MTEKQIDFILNRQRDFFLSGNTFNIKYRLHFLQKFKTIIVKYESEIGRAINNDLGKSACESYMCETGLVLSEIDYMIKHLGKFARNQYVHTPLAQFHAKSFKKPSPYGVVLIMSPWNYPFLLTLEPLVDAISAGNTAILKPSAYSPCTSSIIAKIISECFPSKYVAVVEGGRYENTCLLNKHFDYIFFTGSQTVGREVMKCASFNLTPVTLELGGKSPCIVDKTANLRLAAKRIVFGKFLNCGQTCVAPDYIYCDESIKERLIEYIKHEIIIQFTINPLRNENYGKIINQKHFDRLLNLIQSGDIAYGGNYENKSLKIEPTVLDNVDFSDAVMKEEIFGPILPIVTFKDINSAVSKINLMSHPLALYVFTSNKKAARYVINNCSFGGGCINDTIIHLATCEMGFGGFGESGMGEYHGKAGFDTFSHYKSIVDKKTWIDMPLRYQPYTHLTDKLIHLFLH